jgi:hypothetical protein
MSSPTKPNDTTIPDNKPDSPKQNELGPPKTHLTAQRAPVSTQSSSLSTLELPGPSLTPPKTPIAPKSTTPSGEPSKNRNFKKATVESASPSPPNKSEAASKDEVKTWKFEDPPFGS